MCVQARNMANAADCKYLDGALTAVKKLRVDGWMDISHPNIAVLVIAEYNMQINKPVGQCLLPARGATTH